MILSDKEKIELITLLDKAKSLSDYLEYVTYTDHRYSTFGNVRVNRGRIAYIYSTRGWDSNSWTMSIGPHSVLFSDDGIWWDVVRDDMPVLARELEMAIDRRSQKILEQAQQRLDDIKSALLDPEEVSTEDIEYPEPHSGRDTGESNWVNHRLFLIVVVAVISTFTAIWIVRGVLG